MRLYPRLANSWPSLLAAGLALGALALLWRVRDAPQQLGAFGRVDALGAFFTFALFAGIALALALQPANLSAGQWLAPSATVLALAFNTSLMLATAGAYLLVALLTLGAQEIVMLQPGSERLPLRRRAAGMLRQSVLAAPSLLAGVCLLIGYGALALRGAARYDDRAAGALMDSFVFWFVLLAAMIGCSPLGISLTSNQRPMTDSQHQLAGASPWPAHLLATHRPPLAMSDLLRFAWLYPLARLYSMGPWNTGWSFATLLLGGALALWSACAALVQPADTRRLLLSHTIYLALALAGIGLSSSAGIAAGCYAILAYLTLRVSTPGQVGGIQQAGSPSARDHVIMSITPWLLSSAVPFSAAFVAAWMLTGAAVAGGVALLAGAAWLAALLHGLTTAIWARPGRAGTHQPALGAALASMLLGVGAPLVVRVLILPVVAQLQGGLTPYGEVNIWPWVGLAASDSAHTQVTTLPSIAIAGLMLVLCALVYVTQRLRALRGDGDQPTDLDDERSAGADDIGASPGTSRLLHFLRDEVPWLGGLLGSDPDSQGQRRDSE